MSGVIIAVDLLLRGRADKIAGISDEAVIDATGQPWDHWLALLDDHNGTELDHKERVAVVAEAGVESGWWQQQLAVGYEHDRGLREVGETANAGYQVGIQRTVSVPQDEHWDLLLSEAGLATWLGEIESCTIGPGASYETADGITGEIRAVSEGERLRMTWQPPNRETSTTLQLRLSCPRNGETRTTLRFHHEKLADADEREAMRERWREALDRLEALVEA